MSTGKEQTNPEKFLDIAGGGEVKNKKKAIKKVAKTKKKTAKKKVNKKVKKAKKNREAIVVEEIPAEVEQLLASPDLIDFLIAEVQKKVAGEKDTIRVIVFCAHGRLVKNRAASSYNLVIHATSGSGKDYITKWTLAILPDGVVEARKTISPKTFTYWHNAKQEPNWTWNGKIFYGEDVPNRVLNDETFKLMASGGNGKSTIVIKNKAEDIYVKGSPVMIITSATATLSQENLRRFTLCPLDESTSQTRRIMQRLAEDASTSNARNKPNENIRVALASLQEVEVRIPFAERLRRVMPNSLIVRTVFGRFLDYIRASAALHQYQREEVEPGVILATAQDYDHAREVFLKTSSSRKLIPLSNVDHDILKVMEKEEPDQPDGWFSTSYIDTKLSYGYRAILRHLNGLFATKLVKKDSLKGAGRGRPEAVWKPQTLKELELPTSEELGI